MLYHYITSPLKKQGVSGIFFTLRKNRGIPAAVFANAPENKHSGSVQTKPLPFLCVSVLMPAQAHRQDMYLRKRRSQDMYRRR